MRADVVYLGSDGTGGAECSLHGAGGPAAFAIRTGHVDRVGGAAEAVEPGADARAATTGVGLGLED